MKTNSGAKVVTQKIFLNLRRGKVFFLSSLFDNFHNFIISLDYIFGERRWGARSLLFLILKRVQYCLVVNITRKALAQVECMLRRFLV